MLMRSLNRSFLGLIVLAVSFLLTPTRVFAIDVLPFKFANPGVGADSASQQKAWNEIMKYKLWGTGLSNGDGIVFNGNNIHVTDSSGYVGSATGNFKMVNQNHSIGGPLVFGGSFMGGDGLDSILIGPSHFGGNFDATFNGRNSEFFAGTFCIEGTQQVCNEGNTSKSCADQGFYAGSATISCEGAFPIESNLDVPVIDSVAFKDMLDTTIGAISVNSSTPDAYIDVPPGKGVYDVSVKSVNLGNNKTLYIRMPKNGRLTRIFIEEGFQITNNSNIRVIQANDNSEWDEENRIWKTSDTCVVSNADYSGNVLFYTPESINWTAGKKHIQGTFISGGTITISQDAGFAGQLIAKAVYVLENFHAEDFRYVPFDPPVMDPTLFTTVEFLESNEETVVPLKLNKKTEVQVTFDYCFEVTDVVPALGITSNQWADVTDFNDLAPLCGKSLKKVTIPKGGDEPLEKITINPKLDPYVELYGYSIKERFRLHVYDLRGAVLLDQDGDYVHDGFFDMFVMDVNVVPLTRDTIVVGNEDSPIAFDTVTFVYESITNTAMGGIIVESVPSVGTLTYSGKTVTKGQKIPVDSLDKLVFTPAKDSVGKGDDYAYSSFQISVYDVKGAVSSNDKKQGFKTVTLSVTPVNDPPVVKPATYTISGHVINGGDKAVLDGTIPVTDVDDKSFTYAFDKSDKNFAVVDSLFAIDEATGKIHVKAGVELNENISAAQYTINVIVSDKGATTGGKDIQSATSKVTIEINYKNNPPQIVTDVVHIKENSEPGSATDSSLVAVDKDAGDSVKTFKLVSKSNWFEVSEDGVITVKKDAKIDYEKAKSETLKIQVCDEYNACSESSVVVAIVDVPKSQVKIVEGENPQNTWPNPTTIYTNIPQMELKCTFDGSKTSELCMDTTLVEGCQDLVVKFDNPDLDGAAYDTVEVCYSNAAPVVTIAATENVVKANNIYTIVEKQDADDPNIYVNDPKNLITVTVNDAVLGVPDTFFVGLNLETVALSKNTYSTMESVVKSKFVLNEDRQVVRTPVNGELVENSYVESFNGKDSVKISFNTDEEGNVIKTAYYNEKGKIDSMEVITVSYVTRVGDKYVTVSYQADAVTGKVLNVDSEGNLYESSSKGTSNKGDTKVEVGSYKVSYDYKDGDNFVTVTYAVSESGEIVANESGDIGYKVSYSYTNKFGNSATQSVSIILDRVGPKVEIVSPVEGSVVYANYVDVIWTVNGVEQDTLLLQSLEKGTNAIVRFFKDKAGNTAADTVYVVMKDAKDVEVSIEQPVTVLTQEKVEEYYAANPPKKGETFAVSIRNPTTGKEVETLIGGKFDPKAGSGKEPYPGVSGSTHLGPTLAMDIKLPIINAVGGLATLDDLLNADGRVPLDGVDADNSDRISVEDYVKNYCVDDFKPGSDFSSANLYNSKMDVKIWVYTTLGNFVDYFSFTQDMNDPSFTNEAGLLQMFFEMKPDKDGYVRAENGTLYATGAYLYKVDVKLKSELKCTLPPVNDATGKKKGDIVKSSDDLLKPFGYKRPQLQKQKKKKH